jgi:hypothetical protein
VVVRVGILDLTAAVVFVIALLLPAPARPVRPLYGREEAALALRLAEAQAALAGAPGDSAAAARLADLLVDVHETDWAIRVAAVGAGSPSPEAWRAAVAASAAHMDRREVGPALEWADRALAACDRPEARCPDYERARLDTYAAALKAVHDSGVDPKKNSRGVLDAVERAVPLIRIGPSRPER